ncbi:uncharacterized protein LOC132580638 [Heteronotia binoei]|uniref:uncharacterized protein LOC132580638 n=1 Tax=Heteronotia binoei TaxID=13085 RepID=UPI00292E08F4|nr:uncharacterized protein LOC132580638 [Heteronotia binoei]
MAEDKSSKNKGQKRPHGCEQWWKMIRSKIPGQQAPDKDDVGPSKENLSPPLSLLEPKRHLKALADEKRRRSDVGSKQNRPDQQTLGGAMKHKGTLHDVTNQRFPQSTRSPTPLRSGRGLPHEATLQTSTLSQPKGRGNVKRKHAPQTDCAFEPNSKKQKIDNSNMDASFREMCGSMLKLMAATTADLQELAALANSLQSLGLRSKGLSFEQIQELYSDDLAQNDRMVEQFVQPQACISCSEFHNNNNIVFQ